MGHPENVARGALRVSLGAWNKAVEIDDFVAQLSKAAGLQRRKLPDMQPSGMQPAA
jgi:cysteine sulfinate desulfinase/cysteine desulfurase-like protein